MSLTIGAYACNRLQGDYFEYFGKNAAAYKTGGDTGVLRFLMSPQNTKGFKVINPGADILGKTRGVALMYENPFCFNVANPADVCTEPRVAIVNPNEEAVYDLVGNPLTPVNADGKKASLFFTDAELSRYCTIENSEYISNKVFRFLNAFEEQINKQISNLLIVMAGTNIDGDAITKLPLFVSNAITNTSVLNPDSIWSIDQNYKDIQGNGQYALVGSKVLSKMQTFAKWTNLSGSGIDLGTVDDLNPYTYYDRTLDTSLGQNGFLQMAPGAAHLVVYNKYKGENKKTVSDLYSNGTIVMPMTGIEIDWRWRYDYKCESWEFIPSLYVDLVVNKAGGCGALSTTNGIIRYEDCSYNTTSPTCPPVVVPATAVA